MEDRKLLIVGIDPGTTTAYAVLDIEGRLIHLDSSRQFDLNHLISETINFGKVVLVGTDKVNVPSLVKSFATKLGARIVSPEEDLKIEEKRRITNNFSFDDDHQGDALASALFAYKSTRALLDKIDFFVNENEKHNIRNKIKELVISKKISIKNAVSIIEKRDEESQLIEKVIVDKKINEADFLKLYNKLKKYEAEIKLIKMHNNDIKRKISSLENTIKKIKSKTDDKKPADFRENRIRFLENLIRLKENESIQLKLLIKKFNNIMSNMNDFYILKKLDTLGANEFNFKNKILNIKRNDMLLVDNPNIASDIVVGFLNGKVFVIAHKKPVSKKIEDSMPFVFINATNLKIDEDKYFGFIEKWHFEVEKNKINWAKKVIDDYKREKERLISD